MTVAQHTHTDSPEQDLVKRFPDAPEVSPAPIEPGRRMWIAAAALVVAAILTSVLVVRTFDNGPAVDRSSEVAEQARHQQLGGTSGSIHDRSFDVAEQARMTALAP